MRSASFFLVVIQHNYYYVELNLEVFSLFFNYYQSQGYGGFSLVAHNANPLEVKILCQLRKTFG